MKEAQEKLAGLQMRPKHPLPKWRTNPSSIDKNVAKAIDAEHSTGDDSGDDDDDDVDGDGGGDCGGGGEDGDEGGGRSGGGDSNESDEGNAGAINQVTNPVTGKVEYVATVVAAFNKEIVQKSISADRIVRYTESKHQDAQWCNVPVPDLGHDTVQLLSDVAVKYEGRDWELGQVERIFKKHSGNGTTEYHDPVKLGENTSGIYLLCSWYKEKVGSPGVYTNDSSDIKPVELASVSNVIKFTYNKQNSEFTLSASDRVWLADNLGAS